MADRNLLNGFAVVAIIAVGAYFVSASKKEETVAVVPVEVTAPVETDVVAPVAPVAEPTAAPAAEVPAAAPAETPKPTGS